MMAYEQRDNTGSLFRNDRKESEKHPDFTGSALIGGVDYWISAWTKESANGKKFFSFAFKDKADKGDLREASRKAPAAAGGGLPIDDDIPFAPVFD